MKPTLKAPGTQRLKVKYDRLLSILLQCCFHFKLRRYSKVFPSAQALSNCLWAFTTLRHTQAPKLAGVVAQVMPRLMGQFDPQAAGKGGAFVPQTVSNQLWALATLRCHPGDELMVRRCRLTVSKPVLKAPMVPALGN